MWAPLNKPGLDTPLERDASHGILVSWQNCLYRVAVQVRNKPAGTYTYVITRTDDPNWAESALESYSTPEAASEAGWIALDRIRAAKKPD